MCPSTAVTKAWHDYQVFVHCSKYNIHICYRIQFNHNNNKINEK